MLCGVQVYRGPETKTHLSDLEAGAEYSVRVCPIRQTSGGDLPGAVSPVTTFSTIPFAEQATPTHTAKTHNTHVSIIICLVVEIYVHFKFCKKFVP